MALVGLATAGDREVWEYARDHGYALVSKDSDFRQLAFLYGPPPKVIWLRVGNASTAMVLRALLDHRPAIEAFDSDVEEALCSSSPIFRPSKTILHGVGRLGDDSDRTLCYRAP